MNDNNPITGPDPVAGNDPMAGAAQNPVAPDAAPATGLDTPLDMTSQSDNGLSMADSLASAQDNLTAAGLASPTGPGTMGIDQIGADNPEAKMDAPEAEPLVPAAPVPGSIGSVTSVPAVDAPAPEVTPALEAAPASAPQPAVPDVAQPITPAAAQPITPETPASAPYNPFASAANAPAQSAPAPDVNPAFQPVANPTAPKAKTRGSLDLKSIILYGVIAVLLIASCVFAFLWINAMNNPRIEYVQVPVQPSATVETLSCEFATDYGYLIGDGYSAPAIVTDTITYTDGDVTGATETYLITYATEADATTAKDQLATIQAGELALLSGTVTSEYLVSSNAVEATIESIEDNFTGDDARVLIYGQGAAEEPVDLDSVQAYFEGAGYVCTVE